MVVESEGGVAFLGVFESVVVAGAGGTGDAAEGFVEIGPGGEAVSVRQCNGIAQRVGDEVLTPGTAPGSFPGTGTGGSVAVEDGADAAAESRAADELDVERAVFDFLATVAAVVAEGR